MSEWLIRQFNVEDGEGGIRWHVGDIDSHRVEETHRRVSLYNRDHSRCFGKGLLHATREERKLNDDTRRLRGKHLYRRGQLMSLNHLLQCFGLKTEITNLAPSTSA